MCKIDRMEKLLLLFAGLCCFYLVQAQNHLSLSGRVLGNDNAAVNGGTVRLLNASDSSLSKVALTDDAGNYSFQNIPAGQYLLHVQMLGYTDYFSGRLDYANASREIPPIRLHILPKELTAVTVQSQKPFVEQKLDRIVVNVAGSVTSVGNDSWEMMSKLPGVIVDQNSNSISILGKSGTTVYIDGRPTYLSAEQLAARLKSMDASTIESIEIITSPSSKYDAAGNGGIINIITKKNKTRGLNGSAMARYGIGTFARETFGANLNYRTGRFNLYGSYNLSRGKRWQSTQIDRNFEDGTFTAQYSYQVSHFSSHDFKVGADYYLNDKNIIGASLGGTVNPYDEKGDNTARFLQNNIPSFNVNTLTHNYTKSLNWVYNLNYEHKFRREGELISTDLVYSKYDASDNTQDVNATYYNQDGNLMVRSNGDNPIHQYGDLPSVIEIKTAKVDYALPLAGKAKLEAGAKSSWVSTDNDARYTLWQQNQWVVDSTLTNHFRYKENINALYANFNKDMGKNWSLQWGLRGEQSVTEGHQYSNDSIIKRKYFQLFPTAFLQKQWKGTHTLGATYSRRIDRPDYQSLNPFIYYLDQYTYSAGNPFLRPQISNNFELSYAYRSLITSALSYAHTSKVMTDLLKQIDSSKITFQTKDNLGSTDGWNLRVSLNWPVNKWFTSNTTLYGLRNSIAGKYLDADINMRRYTFGYNTNNVFSLPKGYKLELNSHYHSPILYGLFDVRHQLQIDFGAQKSILKDQGTIVLSVIDIFRSNGNNVNVRYGNINAFVSNRWDSRRFMVAFNYRFSNGSKVQSRNRSSAIEEEQNRIQKSN